MTFRARGSTYRPVRTAAVVSSSHRCASTFRAKCRACSLPAASRYRARYWPSGRFLMLAIGVATLPTHQDVESECGDPVALVAVGGSVAGSSRRSRTGRASGKRSRIFMA